jgi:death-on-curing protein
MRYLSSADLIVIHELLISRMGGMAGITEAGFGRLDQAAAAPQLSAFGAALFGDEQSKAAALCHAIVRGHPFSDGNKRVALVALDVFLASNGYELTATNDEAYETMMALAAGEMERDALIAWVKDHSSEL